MKLSEGRLTTDLHIKDIHRRYIFTLIPLIQIKPKDRLSTTNRNSHQRCSIKKVFLEISQNSQKTPVPEPLF